MSDDYSDESQDLLINTEEAESPRASSSYSSSSDSSTRGRAPSRMRENARSRGTSPPMPKIDLTPPQGEGQTSLRRRTEFKEWQTDYQQMKAFLGIFPDAEKLSPGLQLIPSSDSELDSCSAPRLKLGTQSELGLANFARTFARKLLKKEKKLIFEGF